jgi:hypothetical protein
MLRRILLVMSVAALMAAMMAVTAVPAFATVHPLSKSERSNAPAGTPAATQNPPGITNDFHEPGYTDPDPDDNVEARPILAVGFNSPQGFENPAFKEEG